MSSDVVFDCPHCHQWLEAPPDTIGLFIECPACAEIIKVPTASTVDRARPVAPPPPPPSSEEPKGQTMRIDLPPNLGVPTPPRRRLVIRRKA